MGRELRSELCDYLCNSTYINLYGIGSTFDNEIISNDLVMSKILVIGVGGAGRETVKHMKDTGIPEADYITFGDFKGDDERRDIPHYNLITMNGYCGLSPSRDPNRSKRLAENVEDEIREILAYHFNESELTENKNTNMINDRIKGVLFGQAIGDALGLGTEFMTQKEVNRFYPNGLTDYNQIIQDYHRKRWAKGAWTDDTAMMLCIANAIIKDKDIKLSTIAQNFKDWFNDEPLGIGSNTYKVLSFKDYTDAPQKGAEIIWNLSAKNSAANGAVMRTSIVGLWNNDTERNAAEICKLTHYDPRCVGSCVIISLLINNLVYKNQMLSLNQLIRIGERYDSRIREYLVKASQYDCLEDLVLDDYSMGYTLKTLAASIWCLFHCNSFEEGLLAVVNAGGDSDTNAAVAGSLLGARYGLSTIPQKYIDGLVGKDKLHDIIVKLQNVLS